MAELTEQQLEQVYSMVDIIPLSRPKKNINRDFSDGLLMAEVIHHFNPKIVSTHNYPTANSVNKKISNWNTLNAKVFKKIGIQLNSKIINDIVNGVKGAIEVVLYEVLVKYDKPDQEGRLSVHARKMQNNKNNKWVNGEESQHNGRGQQREEYSHKMQGQQQELIEFKYRQQGQASNEEITDLIDKIEQANLQLLKLTELNKAKQDMIINLQRKMERLLN